MAQKNADTSQCRHKKMNAIKFKMKEVFTANNSNRYSDLYMGRSKESK